MHVSHQFLRSWFYLTLLLLAGCTSSDSFTLPEQNSLILEVNERTITFGQQFDLRPLVKVARVEEGVKESADAIIGDAVSGDNESLKERDASGLFTAFSLHNPGQETEKVILFLGYEQEVELVGLDRPFIAGTMVPGSQVQGALRGDIFLRDEGFSSQALIVLDPGQTRNVQLFTKRILDKPLAFDLRLLHPAWFRQFAEPGLRHFWEGLFQGMIWVLLFYHFLLWVNIRQPTYLYYCLYMVCISGLTLGDFGYWQRYVFGEAPFLGFHLFQLLQYLTGIMTLVFMLSFVRLGSLSPRWYRITVAVIWVNLGLLSLIATYYVLTWDATIISFSKVLIIPFAIFGVWLCYVLVRSKDKVALYFAFAGVVLALAVAINAGFELINPRGETLGTDFSRFYFIQATVIVHLLTFALGMGYRRRQEEAAFQRTRELDELKSRLYTNITHEFRAPLAVMLGLNDQIKGHEEERGLIRRNGNHLLRLINQFLDLAKLESGNLKVNAVQGNIVSYLEYLTESFHSMATDRGIRLVFYAEENEVIMDYDERKIQHIVYNLLSNALKFTSEGGKVVLHLACEQKEGNDWLQLKVQDTGTGISEKQIPFVFDRFYQVDDSTTRAAEGTGIGLALTRELVLLLGGTISVTSQVGVGTTFMLQLPIRREAVNAEPRPAGKPAFPAIADAPPRSLLNESEILFPEDDRPVLLIVEDNLDVITYIRKLLEKPYQVYTAENGQEGVMKALELVPDIIISDVMMPYVNGYKLCETLKQDERTSHVPIILLTAKATEEERIRGLKAGADAFLVKPFNQEELFVRLETLVNLRQELLRRYADGKLEETSLSTMVEETAVLRDELLIKLENTVEEYLSDNTFGVPDLAKAVGHSQMQVYRKLKALLDKTPSQFIRSIRLRKGRELLRDSKLNVSEIAYDIGFSDPNYFTRTFSEAYGMSPSEFRSKA